MKSTTLKTLLEELECGKEFELVSYDSTQSRYLISNGYVEIVKKRSFFGNNLVTFLKVTKKGLAKLDEMRSAFNQPRVNKK